MAEIKKYDINGKELKAEAIEDNFLQVEANPQVVKDYIVAIRANARQWSANTKTRREVRATGKKPHAQKGGGRSRQGCLAAPQYRGGGRVFAPRPKFDQHVKINKSAKRLVVSYLLAEKLKSDSICLLHLGKEKVDKTKQVAEFFKKIGVRGKRILILGDKEAHADFRRSTRNIPKVEFKNKGSLNGYDIALCSNLIVMESALEDLKNICMRQGK